jgi:hypothetical protein
VDPPLNVPVKLASGIEFVSVPGACPAGTLTVTETTHVALAAMEAPVIVNTPVPAPPYVGVPQPVEVGAVALTSSATGRVSLSFAVVKL